MIFEEKFTGEYYASSYVMFNFFAQFKSDAGLNRTWDVIFQRRRLALTLYCREVDLERDVPLQASTLL